MDVERRIPRAKPPGGCGSQKSESKFGDTRRAASALARRAGTPEGPPTKKVI